MRQYLVVDQKSFYASVECVARGMDPMTTNLVVADPDRSKDTICLAVSPSMKALGVKNRCRVRDIPPNIPHIVAPPRMQLYIDCAAAIHGVFLRYVAPEDIYTYSIDESFIDVTPYLKMYGTSARELAKEIIQSVREIVGTVSTCGIGTNMYLAKVALDILAKHDPEFIAELNEETYQETMWDHRPLTDFWRIGPGTERRLRNHGLTTLRDITMCNEDLLYRWFGVDAEILIDHAWGREPTTIRDIKNYKSKAKSMSSSQVLMRDYKFSEGELIAKEMADNLCLDMAAKNLVTESITLWVGYSYTEGVPSVFATVKFSKPTNLSVEVIPAISILFRRIVNPAYAIRRIAISCNDVTIDPGMQQLNMFVDTNKQVREMNLQRTILQIRAKYGKNAILKGMNFQKAATGRERNTQIGGHRGGKNDY